MSERAPHSISGKGSRNPPPAAPGHARTELAAQDTLRLPFPARFEALLEGRGRAALEKSLPAFLVMQRWFAGKAREIRSVRIKVAIPVPARGRLYQFLLLRVGYAQGDPETYGVTLALTSGQRGTDLLRSAPQQVVAVVGADAEEGVLHGAAGEPELARALLEVIARRRKRKARSGELVGVPARALRAAFNGVETPLDAQLLAAEQSNTSIILGRRGILKLIRRLEAGPNPEQELGRFLTERTGFRNLAPLLGSLEYRPRSGEPCCVGVLLAFVENEGDAWRHTLLDLDRYLERVAARSGDEAEAPRVAASLLELSLGSPSDAASAILGASLDAARLLGQRVAELHLALTSRRDEPAFAPEPFTPSYQRALFQSMCNLKEDVFATLRRRAPSLPKEVRPQAERLLRRQKEALRCFESLLSRNLSATRARHHGDLHLGQVLWTGRDFVIIDFEGEPARPLKTRRAKHSPLRDVAGMIRSYHYAAFHALHAAAVLGLFRPRELHRLSAWTEFWYAWVSSAFLRSYVESAKGGVFLPKSRAELDQLLCVYLLEKAIYELGYELNNRPDWVRLPLRGILQLLDARAAAEEGR